MDYLTHLDQTITSTLTTERIGTPVFVRWTAAVATSKEDLKEQLATMTIHANRWLAIDCIGDLHRLYATGAEAQGHLSLSLTYTTGVSALLALTLAHNRPHSNLAIYGNSGAIYHNDFIVPARDGAVTRQSVDDNGGRTMTQGIRVILDAIDASLAQGQPSLLMATGGHS